MFSASRYGNNRENIQGNKVTTMADVCISFRSRSFHVADRWYSHTTSSEISLVVQTLSFHPTRRSKVRQTVSQTIQLTLHHPLVEVQHIPRPRKTVPPPKTFEDESSAGESGDEYVQDSAPSKTKRRTKRRDDDDDDSRRPVQRKRKRKVLVEQDLSELPPEQGEYAILLKTTFLMNNI